jgi:hypothetical protein
MPTLACSIPASPTRSCQTISSACIRTPSLRVITFSLRVTTLSETYLLSQQKCSKFNVSLHPPSPPQIYQAGRLELGLQLRVPDAWGRLGMLRVMARSMPLCRGTPLGQPADA